MARIVISASAADGDVGTILDYLVANEYADGTVTVRRMLHGKQSITGALLARR